MDITQLMVKLIKNYNNEHNRYLRAQKTKKKISKDEEFRSELQRHNLRMHYDTNVIYKEWRNMFLDDNRHESKKAFVSQAIKNACIKQYLHDIGQTRTHKPPPPITILQRQVLDGLQDAPVLRKLGKMWRMYIDSMVEEKKSYQDRWIARCAIKGFNKLDLGMKIKFGQRINSSNSRIAAINIDGFDIPIKKFLADAQFEQAILDAA